jgi:peroxiredoxin
MHTRTWPLALAFVLTFALVWAGCATPVPTVTPVPTAAVAAQATPLSTTTPLATATSEPVAPASAQATPTALPQQSIPLYPKAPQVGEVGPDVLLRDVDGNDIALSNYRGKVLVIHFFSTWCSSCITEVPHLVALYDEYRAQGVEMVSIAGVEPPAQLKRFAQRHAMPFTVLTDPNSTAHKLYAVRGLPLNVILDADGVIRLNHTGYLDDEQLKGYIEEVLG